MARRLGIDGLAWYSRNIACFSFVGTARLRDEVALPLTALGPLMDLNYLYERYFISLQLAESAACDSSRNVHRKLAEGYAARIADAKTNGTPTVAQ